MSHLKSLVTLFLLSVWSLGARTSTEREKVEIIRDKWGIPHIFADTDEGAMYGLGYATAEDRAFQMHYSLRIVQGRVSEIFGRDFGITRKGKSTSALQHDVKMRTIGFYYKAMEVAASLKKQGDESYRMLQAYSNGVNHYMKTNRDKLLYLFDKTGLAPEPWTPADCIASWWHLGQFFATDGLGDYKSLLNNRQKGRDGRSGSGQVAFQERKPVNDEAASVVLREDVTDEWLKKLHKFMEKYGIKSQVEDAEEGPKFSHAWVVGGDKTTTGSAVLVSDPQTAVRNPALWYEFHIKGETFNARGIGVAGSPVILIGWNEKVAWGLTALGVDQADLFILKTDRDHQNQYYMDDSWHEFKLRDEIIRIKNDKDVVITVKESFFGPVVSSIANGVPRGKEVALKRVPLCITNSETIQSSIKMLRSKNARDFIKAIDGWDFPSANCVFGDSNGDIGYSVVAAIPIRSTNAIDVGNKAHDGSSSKNDWQEFIPSELLPRVINPKRGFLESANHRTIGSFYPLPIGAGQGARGDTTRSWRLRQRLAAKEKFTPEEVLDVHYDSTNATRKAILDIGYHLRDTQKEALSENALRTLDYLRDWHNKGAKMSFEIKGTEVAMMITYNRQFANTFGISGGDSGMCYFLKQTLEKLSQDPDAVLEDLEIDFINGALSETWSNAQKRFERTSGSWLEEFKKPFLRKELGYFVSLDGFPSLDNENDVKQPSLDCVDGATIKSQQAQSYTQWVPMRDVDSARSILPPGNSEHPDSPYYKSAYKLWSGGELHSAPLSRDRIEEIKVGAVTLEVKISDE